MPLTKLKASNLEASAVTTHQNTFDDASVRNDIATLALHSAIADNKAAHNLSNSFIDQFEDDTGLDVQTDCSNVSEYMASVSGSAIDSNTLLLLQMNGSNDGTNFTDSAPTPLTITNSNVTTTTDDKKFGTASGDFTVNGSHLYVDAVSSLNFASNSSFTFDFWCKIPSAGGTLNNRFFQKGANHSSGYGMFMDGSSIYFGWDDASVVIFNRNLVVGTGNWHHIAVVRDTANIAIYLDGESKDTATDGQAADHNADTYIAANPSSAGTDDRFNGYLDEFRISNVARWTSGFTPPTAQGGIVNNTAGNFTSATQTANTSVSKMGIVVLYKDNAGTASLNNDIVAQVSANGGTNYSNATLVAGGTFSSGIKIAAVSGVSVTAGTAPKYKISFANQASGSKETQVHGVALLY
jgi:hypothetical protein